MKITIENTSKMVELSGVPARIWEGKTESGIPVICYITRIAVPKDENMTIRNFSASWLKSVTHRLKFKPFRYG